MKRGFAQTPAGQIHYIDEGKGDTLLMLHETPRSIRSYEQMIPHLAKSFRVVAMDTLGFGESDRIPDSFESVTDFARNVVDFMDALGIQSAHVVGDHTGACIGVELAIMAPDRVKRLVLAGLPMWTSAVERESRLAQGMRDYPEVAVPDGSHLALMWERLVTVRIPKADRNDLTADDLDLLMEQLVDRIKAGYSFRRLQPILFGGDQKPRLGMVKCQTLSVCVTGEGSTPYTKRAREAAACIPNCKVHIFEGVDGRVNRTHAKEFSEVIRSFLTGAP